MSDTRAELADLKQHLRGMQAEFANQMAEFARTVADSLAAAPHPRTTTASAAAADDAGPSHDAADGGRGTSGGTV
jgi:hypothetical protein